MIKILKFKVLLLLLVVILFGCTSSTRSSASWLSVETKHLILHYKPRSFAASNLKRAASEYERSYIYATRIMPFVNTKAKLDVYLHNSLKAAGHANRSDRSSHYVYSRYFKLTSPHEMMHHFLYELNPKVPLRVEEGVCRFFETRTILTSTVSLYQLAKSTSPMLWDVRQVFKDHYKTDDEGNVAAAFTAFASQTLGWNKFWQFYRTMDKRRWKSQLESTFGKDIVSINRDFGAFIRNLKRRPVLFR